MPQRHELAEIAVAFHARCQQHQVHAREVLRFVERSGGWRVMSGEFRQARNVQCHADNRFYSRFLRQLVKLYRRIQPVGIRQRDGRHFLLNRGGNDLLRRRHAAQKRIVAMTMQMYEQGNPSPEREEGMPAFWQACLFIRIR